MRLRRERIQAIRCFHGTKLSKCVYCPVNVRFRHFDNEDNNETETNENRPILWLEMPYIGTRGEQLLRGFKKKLLRCLNVNVQIKTRITTTKLNLFTNTKDKFLNKTNPMLSTNLLVLNVIVATLVKLTGLY